MEDRKFRLQADYQPAGDQPAAIAGLIEGLENGLSHQTLLGVTGSGKSIGYDDEVYIVEHIEGRSRASLVRAGPFIDQLIAEHGAAPVGGGDTERYGCVGRAFSAPAFDVRRGVADLHRVGAFLRHRAPQQMFELETRCGRTITLTGDHNLWVLRDGMPALIRTEEALATDYIPVPETLGSTGDLRELDVLPYLSETKLSVFADESVLAYVSTGGQSDFVNVMRTCGINPYRKLFAMRKGIRGRGIKVHEFIQLGLYSAGSCCGLARRWQARALPYSCSTAAFGRSASLVRLLHCGGEFAATVHRACQPSSRAASAYRSVTGEPWYPVPHPPEQRLRRVIDSARTAARQLVRRESTREASTRLLATTRGCFTRDDAARVLRRRRDGGLERRGHRDNGEPGIGFGPRVRPEAVWYPCATPLRAQAGHQFSPYGWNLFPRLRVRRGGSPTVCQLHRVRSPGKVSQAADLYGAPRRTRTWMSCPFAPSLSKSLRVVTAPDDVGTWCVERCPSQCDQLDRERSAEAEPRFAAPITRGSRRRCRQPTGSRSRVVEHMEAVKQPMRRTLDAGQGRASDRVSTSVRL